MTKLTSFLISVLTVISLVFIPHAVFAENIKIIQEQKQPSSSVKPPSAMQPATPQTDRPNVHLAPRKPKVNIDRVERSFDVQPTPQYNKGCVDGALAIVNLEAADAAGFIENNEPGFCEMPGEESTLANWCRNFLSHAVQGHNLDYSEAWVCVDNRSHITQDPYTFYNPCAGDGANANGGGHYFIGQMCENVIYTHCCYPKRK